MERVKQFGTWGLAALVTAPVVLYTAICSTNAVKMWWKMGWESRPFIYISTSGILVFEKGSEVTIDVFHQGFLVRAGLLRNRKE